MRYQRPVVYGDGQIIICGGAMGRLLIESFVQKNINKLLKEAIDQEIQDMRQVFQIWHILCSEQTSMNF
jgi:UDP-N-acetylglucosamine:LPS N-acetylglucosamine transferase